MGLKNLLKAKAVVQGGDVLANYNDMVKDANTYGKKCVDEKFAFPVKNGK